MLLACLLALSSRLEALEIVRIYTTSGLMPVVIEIERSRHGALVTNSLDERYVPDGLQSCLVGLERSKVSRLSNPDAENLLKVVRQAIRRERPSLEGVHSTALKHRLTLREGSVEQSVVINHDPADATALKWISRLRDDSFFEILSNIMVSRTVKQFESQQHRPK